MRPPSSRPASPTVGSRPHADERSRAGWIGPTPQGSQGFTLFEVLLGLLLMALLAALALPGPARPTGPAALRTAVYQVSALLRSVRTDAVAQARAASVVVDTRAGRVEGAGRRVDMPPGITLAVADPRRPLIRFASDGSATETVLWLSAATTRMSIAVNPDTGAIGLAP